MLWKIALISTLLYYTALAMLDKKSRQTYKLKEATENAIGKTGMEIEEEQAELLKKETAPKEALPNLFGATTDYDELADTSPSLEEPKIENLIQTQETEPVEVLAEMRTQKAETESVKELSETPTQKSQTKPAEELVEMPTQKSQTESVKELPENSIQKSEAKPTEELVETPTQKPQAKSVKELPETPTQKLQPKPVEELVETSTQKLEAAIPTKIQEQKPQVNPIEELPEILEEEPVEKSTTQPMEPVQAATKTDDEEKRKFLFAGTSLDTDAVPQTLDEVSEIDKELEESLEALVFETKPIKSYAPKREDLIPALEALDSMAKIEEKQLLELVEKTSGVPTA